MSEKIESHMTHTKTEEESSPIKIQNLKNLLLTPVEEEAIYEVEPEVIEWAKLHAKMYLQRYDKEPGLHWKAGEQRNTYVGMMGQKIFDIILQQLAIPKDHNDPVRDWRRVKDYDFKIPDFGTVEVKCFDDWQKKVLIKTSEWHGNDYCVIFKFMDKEPERVQMLGWLTKAQVENLDISRAGEHYTPVADAYITDLDKQNLNPPKTFFILLEKTQPQ